MTPGARSKTASCPAPSGPPGRLVAGRATRALYVPDSGRLIAVPPGVADALGKMLDATDYQRARSIMAAAGLSTPAVEQPIPTQVPLRTISLSIAGACNLACTYCYAQQGSFGGDSRPMSESTAFAAVERLVAAAKPGEQVRIVFLGGEPLTNRVLLRSVSEHGVALGQDAGVQVAFSVTTNGTLMTPPDADFFDDQRFAVTISIDGIGEAHDALRPSRGGRATYARVISGARLLLDRAGRKSHVMARASITPNNLDLPTTLSELASLGFDSVQFSPVLSAPDRSGEMDTPALDRMLAQMIACGEIFEAELRAGRILPFGNIISTLRRIHERARDEYGCAAGGSYAGVGAGGSLYACHRFVDDERARLGDSDLGIDPTLQMRWLRERNVHAQPMCSVCWARPLCGGGCHFEVLNRGRPACDYIRGWLDYCLGAYLRLHEDGLGAAILLAR